MMILFFSPFVIVIANASVEIDRLEIVTNGGLFKINAANIRSFKFSLLYYFLFLLGVDKSHLFKFKSHTTRKDF